MYSNGGSMSSLCTANLAGSLDSKQYNCCTIIYFRYEIHNEFHNQCYAGHRSHESKHV